MPDELGEYRVELEAYHGPLDLLLFLIRREEIDIYDIPIARITHQYVAYVEVIRQVDPEAVGEFLVMAATLMEIKSRALLPEPPAEVQDGEAEWLDPRLELVRELLEYKAIKDAARHLDALGRDMALKHPRFPVLPVLIDEDRDLGDLQVWDLLEAFNRILQETGGGARFHQVVMDDTPIALHAEEVLEQLRRVEGGRIQFREVFFGRSRGEMIGLFLALLELIRERHVRALQETPLGEIALELLDDAPLYSRSLDPEVAMPQSVPREALLRGQAAETTQRFVLSDGFEPDKTAGNSPLGQDQNPSESEWSSFDPAEEMEPKSGNASAPPSLRLALGTDADDLEESDKEG